MCQTKEHAKTKLDQVTEAMNRLSAAVQSLNDRLSVAPIPIKPQPIDGMRVSQV